ncbi:MAG: ketopantoate reductase family protein [Bifidobacteriaceae bacterium]|jgi:2-dehydropantoate 2-reductase|nr:ketopantoate reductase family protein [Bifidobacteriaceae bacterium]
MRVLVYGAGGLGLYFAARLAQAGCQVILKGRPEAVSRGREEPLRVVKDARVDEVRGIEIVDSLGGVGAEAAIITTKAWQVEHAARDISTVLQPGAPVLTVQNGIDAPTRAALHLRPQDVFAATVVVIASKSGVLDVSVLGEEAALTLGSPVGADECTAAGLVEALTDAGMAVTWTDHIDEALWKKLALICSYGGIGAVLDATVGQTRGAERTRHLVLAAMDEVFAVARAEGVILTGQDKNDIASVYLTGFAPDTTSSMHRDLLAGRPSELEDQLGAVVTRAERHGVPVPILHLVYAVMSPREARARDA